MANRKSLDVFIIVLGVSLMYSETAAGTIPRGSREERGFLMLGRSRIIKFQKMPMVMFCAAEPRFNQLQVYLT